MSVFVGSKISLFAAYNFVIMGVIFLSILCTVTRQDPSMRTSTSVKITSLSSAVTLFLVLVAQNTLLLSKSEITIVILLNILSSLYAWFQ
jgi:hypothetical protein